MDHLETFIKNVFFRFRKFFSKNFLSVEPGRPHNGAGTKISSNFDFNMLTLRIGPFRNFEKKFSFFEIFWIIHKFLVDFRRKFELCGWISPERKFILTCGFLQMLHIDPCCLHLQYKNIWKILNLKKWPKTTQKVHENWPFSCQYFTQKTTCRQKSDATLGKGNFP